MTFDDELTIAGHVSVGAARRRDPAPGRAPVTARLAPRIMRAAADAPRPDAEAAVATAASSSGAPLPDELRARFETSLGADLSGVRVHTGAESAAAARALGARAYTTGADIHFAAGQYQPLDPFGVHLLAHEVAHTVQQAGAPAAPQCQLEVSEPGDALEREADRAADAMVAGAAVTVSAAGAGIQRDPDPAAKPSDGNQERADTVDVRWGVNWKGMTASRDQPVLRAEPLRAPGDAAWGELKVTPYDGKLTPRPGLSWYNGAPSGGVVPVGNQALPKGKGGQVATDVHFGHASASVTIAIDHVQDPTNRETPKSAQDAAAAAVQRDLPSILNDYGDPRSIELMLTRSARRAIGAFDDVSVTLARTPLGTSGAGGSAHAEYAPVASDCARIVDLEVPCSVETSRDATTTATSTGTTRSNRDAARVTVNDLSEDEKVKYKKVLLTLDAAFANAFKSGFTSWHQSDEKGHIGAGGNFGGRLHGNAGADVDLGGTVDVDRFDFRHPRLPLTVRGSGQLRADGSLDLDLDGDVHGDLGGSAGYSDETLKGFLIETQSQSYNKVKVNFDARAIDFARAKHATTTTVDLESTAQSTSSSQRSTTRTETSLRVHAVPGEPKISVKNG